MGRADVYSQPDAPDPLLPAELVRELVEPHLPSDLRLSDGMVVDESGGEARVYLFDRADVGGGVAVKTQRPHRLRPRTSLAKEAALLAALAGPLAGRIPAVHGYDRVDTAEGPVELIVMSRVPGRPVCRTTIARPARSELLRRLADVLRAVHALDPAELVTSGLLPADEGVAGLRSRLEPNFADLAEKLEGRPASWPMTVSPSRVSALALDALPKELTQPVVLHSNPGITHVFTDPVGVFSGLIDFGDAYASHPALDLRAWPDPDDRLELRRHYMDGYTASADWDAVWTSAMIYADMAALTGPPAQAERAAADLRERLDEV
jgi:hygromycin-B 7''-O-kinase